jgi:aspartyl-tRNA(Asn)/glutamyl-tRNA(Gln) amidotransferase subunit C
MVQSGADTPVERALSIDPSEIEHLSRLSHVGLTPQEIVDLCAEVSGIVAHVEELNTVDTEGVPPTSFAVPMDTVLRDDEVRPSWSPAAVLANAPSRSDDLFQVQAVFD